MSTGNMVDDSEIVYRWSCYKVDCTNVWESPEWRPACPVCGYTDPYLLGPSKDMRQ